MEPRFRSNALVDVWWGSAWYQGEVLECYHDEEKLVYRVQVGSYAADSSSAWARCVACFDESFLAERGEHTNREEPPKWGSQLDVSQDLPEGWFAMLTQEENTYYWHRESGESQWEKPSRNDPSPSARRARAEGASGTAVVAKTVPQPTAIAEDEQNWEHVYAQSDSFVPDEKTWYSEPGREGHWEGKCLLCGCGKTDGHLHSSNHVKNAKNQIRRTSFTGNVEQLVDDLWQGAPKFGKALQRYWGKFVRMFGSRVMHHLEAGALKGCWYRIGGKRSTRYHLSREETLASMDEIRRRGVPMSWFIHYRHEGSDRHAYGQDHAAGIWPIAPIQILGEYDGVILVVVVCIVQVAEALGEGQIHGWVTALDNLFFFNGENVEAYLREHMPWLFDNRGFEQR